MKNAKAGTLAFLGLALLAQIAGAAVWEGSANSAAGRSLQGEAYGIATNSFPRNTVVDVTNLENSRTVRVLVVSGQSNSGLLATLSRSAAESIGISGGSVRRVRISQPADAVAFAHIRRGPLPGPAEEAPGAEAARPHEAADPEPPETAGGAAATAAPGAGAAGAPAEAAAPTGAAQAAATGRASAPGGAAMAAGAPAEAAAPAAAAVAAGAPAQAAAPDGAAMAAGAPAEAEAPTEPGSWLAGAHSRPGAAQPAAAAALLAAPAPGGAAPSGAAPGGAQQAAQAAGAQQPRAIGERTLPASMPARPARTIAHVPQIYVPNFRLIPTEERLPPAPREHALAPEYFIQPIELGQEAPEAPIAEAMEPGALAMAEEPEPACPSAEAAQIAAEAAQGGAHGGAAHAALFSAVASLERDAWYVQLGAFRDPLSAAEEIGRAGAYPALVQQIGSEAEPMFRVLLGPLNQGESAALLRRVRSVGNGEAFVRQGERIRGAPYSPPALARRN